MPSEIKNNRKSERAYVIETKDISINGKAFRLKDIALGGFGVIVEGEHTFFIGQRLNNIELKADSRSKTIKGIVSHITKDQQHIICGIRFEFVDHDEMEFVAKLKSKIEFMDG